jgi:myo-inositol-1(or 4)-monophosphatase
MEPFFKDTITEAGKAIMEFFGHAKVIKEKDGVWDIVTEADLASEKIIIEKIKATYPEHGIVSEESEGYNPASDYQWYIDPLDGTLNYERGVQIFGINMALAHKGELTHAAILLPALNEFCYAEKGKGVWLNGTQVFCSDMRSWEQAPYGIGSVKFKEKHIKLLHGLMECSQDTMWMNAIGCTAATGIWLAAGKRDFYIGPGTNPWDYAAPALLAKEAGCVVTNYKGDSWKIGDAGLVVANQYLHPQLLKVVKESYNI